MRFTQRKRRHAGIPHTKKEDDDDGDSEQEDGEGAPEHEPETAAPATAPKYADKAPTKAPSDAEGKEAAEVDGLEKLRRELETSQAELERLKETERKRNLCTLCDGTLGKMMVCTNALL